MNSMLQELKREIKGAEDLANEDFYQRFTSEILKSERIRTMILAGMFLMGTIMLAVAPLLFRTLFVDMFYQKFHGFPLHLLISFLLLCFFIYECLVFVRYTLFTSKAGKLVTAFQFINTTIETSLPTVLIAVLFPLVGMPVIFAPIVYFYFFFIALSILRLSFPLSVYTGAIAAIEYFLIYWFMIRTIDDPTMDLFLVAPGNHMFKVVFFLALGVAIGFVTLEIRRRVFNSIRFVEERSNLLNEYAVTLEKQVGERTEELSQSLKEVEASNNKITDSIHYARRIQNALLTSNANTRQLIPSNFILWQPRDIVGGDIYVIEPYHEGVLVAVFDCTGHGVPGAFMTMIVSSAIREVLSSQDYKSPAELLAWLNRYIKLSLHQDSDLSPSDDGLDASICYLNKSERFIEFAGARQSLIYFESSAASSIKGDRHSIGYKNSDIEFKFTNHKIVINEPITFYLYTDGITDQLGGEKRIAFGRKRFKALLERAVQQPITEQKEYIMSSVSLYRGENEVQDDVTLLGIRWPE